MRQTEATWWMQPCSVKLFEWAKRHHTKSPFQVCHLNFRAVSATDKRTLLLLRLSSYGCSEQWEQIVDNKGPSDPPENTKGEMAVLMFQTHFKHPSIMETIFLWYLFSSALFIQCPNRTYLTETQSLTPTFSGRRLTWINPPPPTVDDSNRHMHHTCKYIP